MTASDKSNTVRLWINCNLDDVELALNDGATVWTKTLTGQWTPATASVLRRQIAWHRDPANKQFGFRGDLYGIEDAKGYPYKIKGKAIS